MNRPEKALIRTIKYGSDAADSRPRDTLPA